MVSTAINLDGENRRRGLSFKVAVEFHGVEAELRPMLVPRFDMVIFKFIKSSDLIN